MSARTHVVVVGGGVAALEACLALRALAGTRVLITLIAPNAYFTYRPLSIHDPLAACGRARAPLARLARDTHADLRHDRMVAVDPATRRLYTASGYEVGYDALVLAVGATAYGGPAGAVPLEPSRIAECRAITRALELEHIRSVAFVEPPAPAQALELYDLAIDSAVTARLAGAAPALTLVTAQPAPLAIAGARAAGALGMALASHGISVVESAYVRDITDRGLALAPGSRHVFAERIIAAPRLRGPRLLHMPSDADGFIAVDPLGRVAGVEGVFAAGDCAAFPVKHASLAAQQAEAVASAIAAQAGAPCQLAPFKPVLRCTLPSRLRWYVDAPLTGGLGDATCLSAHPLWAGDTRFDAQRLTPWLGDLQDGERADCGDDGADHERVHRGHHAAAAVGAH